MNTTVISVIESLNMQYVVIYRACRFGTWVAEGDMIFCVLFPCSLFTDWGGNRIKIIYANFIFVPAFMPVAVLRSTKLLINHKNSNSFGGDRNLQELTKTVL